MHVHLAEKTNWPPALGVLNPLIGTFQVTGQNDSWNIFYSLSALTKGRYKKYSKNHSVLLLEKFLSMDSKLLKRVANLSFQQDEHACF
jgi:hypothetical protein